LRTILAWHEGKGANQQINPHPLNEAPDGDKGRSIRQLKRASRGNTVELYGERTKVDAWWYDLDP
jgi:hypothetical protein